MFIAANIFCLQYNGEKFLTFLPKHINVTSTIMFGAGDFFSACRRDIAKRLKSSLLGVFICLLRICTRSGGRPETKLSEKFLRLINKIYYSFFFANFRKSGFKN